MTQGFLDILKVKEEKKRHTKSCLGILYVSIAFKRNAHRQLTAVVICTLNISKVREKITFCPVSCSGLCPTNLDYKSLMSRSAYTHSDDTNFVKRQFQQLTPVTTKKLIFLFLFQVFLMIHTSVGHSFASFGQQIEIWKICVEYIRQN